MMISPETYYEEYLQGKGKSAILQQISLLKKEIDRLKEVMETDENSPEAMVMPSPWSDRLYREFNSYSKS
jgi:hypothetical protein